MNRSARGSKKSSSNGQNLVTILFVLGIIGWGFFAIDRLTESEQGPKANKIQGRALGQEAGWKKTVRDWLTKKLSSEGVKGGEGQSVSRNIPLEPEPKGLKRQELQEEEPALVAEKEEPLAASAAPEEESNPAVFLFYKLNAKGNPVLSQVKRDLGEKTDLKTMVSQLIKGPTMREQDKDYIDSFIRKPRILGAGVEGRCAFVNFDSTFGAGVSYQTLRFQIQQLYRNMEAWKGVHCLELKVRGQYSPHLGSDGLYFPKRIDSAWLKENL